ncbi:MMPL family transporter [Corynebacterium striatum]|uniref:MMPL family transporter n=1 Tax=Corynebacterium striatum TaxID=43770 RepID=UPI000667AA91|nr:MMPL family transporter [Corynebacterium striatum]MDK8788983.1 MMPL family transporter [Corynebacterium striatum]MDK8881868.1 MMPL family transporter [Corynebacterium striatum]VFB07360.1 RND superfamily drug exporter [Corynebacterium striatum]HAT1303501.1 MMPL family transporter [Corynebacterium striatum]HAT1392202.1 MMPL family transporter [Corynebacterium striatum]
MSKFLYHLGSWSYRKVWPFLAFWLVLLVAMGGLTGAFAKSPSPTFSMPDMDSTVTQEQMMERFGTETDAMSAPSATITLQAPEGKKLTDKAVMGEVDSMIKELQGTDALKDPDAIVNPVMASMGMQKQMTEKMAAQGMPQEQIDSDLAALSPLSEDKRTGTISINFDAASVTEIPAEEMTAVTDVLKKYDDGDLTVKYGGNAFNGATEMNMVSEVIGLIVAAIVLLITFGSFVAAGMPLISAVVGVGVGILGVQLATVFTDSVSDMTPMLASMIGLAVGIDYALFIVARFRNELITSSGLNDLSPKELAQELKKMDKATRAHAMGMALGTAGSSVVFAGATVVIALAALTIIGIPFLSTMAIAAAATVVVAVCVALTFIPGLLGLFGTKVFAGRVPGPKVPDPEDEKPTMGLKWVRRIRAHPRMHLIAGVLLLGILALPAANLRLAMPTDGTSKLGTPQRDAYEMTEEAFGPGRNAPMIAYVDVADVAKQDRMPAFQELLKDFSETEGVVNAQIVATTDNMDAAQILITPTTGATDETTTETLEKLRGFKAEFEDNTGGTYGITGITPIFDDISQKLSDVLLPYIAIVLGLAFIVLLLVFRSIWVPLIAAAGFGLSMAATFGVTVAIFQEGMFGIIDDPQPLLSFLPIILIGLTFGLAMDYQVFLVTRMREGFVHGKTAGNATSNGFKHGARTVTAAALIMISVFAAFMLIDLPFIKTMGFALAVGVFMDAFVVRMMIIPATMFLLDKKAWSIPKWLDRILPNMDIEGEALSAQHEELQRVSAR